MDIVAGMDSRLQSKRQSKGASVVVTDCKADGIAVNRFMGRGMRRAWIVVRETRTSAWEDARRSSDTFRLYGDPKLGFPFSAIPLIVVVVVSRGF